MSVYIYLLPPTLLLILIFHVYLSSHQRVEHNSAFVLVEVKSLIISPPFF